MNFLELSEIVQTAGRSTLRLPLPCQDADVMPQDFPPDGLKLLKHVLPLKTPGLKIILRFDQDRIAIKGASDPFLILQQHLHIERKGRHNSTADPVPQLATVPG